MTERQPSLSRAQPETDLGARHLCRFTEISSKWPWTGRDQPKKCACWFL